jgi:hypothetical protein
MYLYTFNGKLPAIENTGALNNVSAESGGWRLWIQDAVLHIQTTSAEDWQEAQAEARRRTGIFLENLSFKYNMRRFVFDLETFNRVNLSDPNSPAETLKTVCATVSVNYEAGGTAPTYTKLSSHPIAVKAREYYIEGLNKPEELFYLYKAVETLKDFLGREWLFGQELGVSNKVVKEVKKLANLSRHDERHAPKPGEVVIKLTPAEILEIRENVKKLIEAFQAKFPK